MRTRTLQERAPRSWMLVFDAGDDFQETLLAFAREKEIAGATFSAIGTFQHATLGYWDLERKEYLHIDMPEQVEVCSLTGNVARSPQGEPKVHAHAVIGRRDGSTRAGHVVSARVRPTLELVLTETPEPLTRRLHPALGLALLD